MAEINVNGNGMKAVNKILAWVLGLGVTIAILFLTLLISRLDTLSYRISTNDIALSGMREQIHQLQAISTNAHEAHVVNEVRWSEVQGRLQALEESIKAVVPH